MFIKAVAWVGIGAGIVAWIARQLLRRSIHLPADLQMKLFLVRLPKETTKASAEKQDTDSASKEKIQEQIAIAENFFSTIGGLRAQGGWRAWLFGRHDHLSFEIVAHQGVIAFYVAVPVYLQRYVEQQIHAHYPYAVLEEVEDYNIFRPTGAVRGGTMVFRRDNIFPIKTYRKLDTDSLSPLTNTLSKLGPHDGAVVQFVVRSAKKSWHERGAKVASKMQQGKRLQEAMREAGIGNVFTRAVVAIGKEIGAALKAGSESEKEKAMSGKKDDYRLSPMEEEIVKGLEEKTSKAGIDANIRIIVSAQDEGKCSLYLENIGNAFAQFNVYQYGNAFHQTIPRRQGKLISDFIHRNFNSGKRIVLNTEEAATVFHFPLPTLETPNIMWLTARKAPPPSDMPSEGILLGYNEYRGIKTDVRMLPGDRRRHLYVIGMTGTGKSTLMEEMAKQDIAAGHGVCVVDPHGTLIENILPCVPKERVEDVIVFNPADIDRPIGLNMLEANTPEEMDFVTQEMIQIFYKLVTDPSMIGPMFEHYMRNAMLTLMADKKDPGTIVEIPRMFTDEDFQEYKLKFVKDPLVRSFWEKEMAQTTGQTRSDMLGYLISKVGRFVENEMVRNIIGQPRSGFDFREVMDKKKVLLINLSKGKVGEVNSNLLGLIAVTKLQMAALSRADIPEEERHDFYLYIDEFQNFVTDSIATILAEARKYRLNLIMAHQYIGQLVKEKDTSIKDAVFGNAGSIVSFRIGVDDAEFMAKQFAPVFGEFDLINIEKFNAYIRLLINNTAARPFNMHTYPPTKGNPAIAEAIIELSRLKYGRPREEVFAEILERSKLGEVMKEASGEEYEPSL